MATRYVSPEDASEQVAELMAAVLAGLVSAQPVLETRREPYLEFQLALHPEGDEPFFLLYLPDGPCLAVSPITTAAEGILGRAVGQLTAWTESGAAAWANRQRWTPVIGVSLARGPHATWHIYDPREAH